MRQQCFCLSIMDKCRTQWKTYCVCRAWVGKRQILFLEIFIISRRSSSIRIVSGFQIESDWLIRKTLLRLSPNCVRCCRPKSRPTSAIVSYCMGARSALQESPLAASAVSGEFAESREWGYCNHAIHGIKYNNII